MLRPRELFQDAPVQLLADMTFAREGQVWVGTGVPASREEAGSVFRIMQHVKIALGHPINQRFSVWTGDAIAPVYMLAVKITCVETGVWEHWDASDVIRDVGGLWTLTIFTPSSSTQSHSTTDPVGVMKMP